MAVGVKGSARKTNCAGCFLFFRRPTSTVVNPSGLSNRLKPQNLLPPPWGRVGERAFYEWRQPFPQHSTAPIQASRLVALSLTLSHGREDGVAVGVKGSARKIGCACCFFSFQTTFINAQFRQPAPCNFQNPIKSAICYRAGCFSNSCNTRRISASTSFVCCKIS